MDTGSSAPSLGSFWVECGHHPPHSRQCQKRKSSFKTSFDYQEMFLGEVSFFWYFPSIGSVLTFVGLWTTLPHFYTENVDLKCSSVRNEDVFVVSLCFPKGSKANS